MADHVDIAPFDEPVHVQSEDGERGICNTREAAEMLLYDWPIGETGVRIQARMVCMKVLAGSEPPAIARTAFMQAAREAHILAEA